METKTRTRQKTAGERKVRNVTLSLPEPLLQRFRVYAAEHGQSMTTLMTTAIRKLLDEDEAAAAAARRLIQRMRNSPDRGIGEKITWTRDDLYDR